MRTNISISALLLFILPLTSISQNTEAIRAKYPGEEAVILSMSETYKITIENGVPVVESKDNQQLLYLSANTSAYMSRYGFSHSGFNPVLNYEAYTKTADNKKVKVTEFKTNDNNSSSIFYDDIKETMFDFPALGPGAVGNLDLTIAHKEPKLLSPFYFSRRIPVINAELKLIFPKEMYVKFIIKGLEKDRIQFTQDTKRGDIIYSFKATDMPAEKPYADAPDNAYYATHIIFFIEKYKNEKNEEISYLGGLDDLHKMNYGHVMNINKEVSPETKRIVDSLIANTTSPEQKARKIYQWVQKSIKYVAFENGMEGFIPRDANLVCSRRFGDCKDMSSILTLMLNYAGVTAYYTWIGTRHIPYDYNEVPTPIVDNHMICTIKLGDEYIFLDGTDPTCVFGIPSEHIQGKQAFLGIDEKNYKILRVPVPSKEISQVADTTYLELTESGIKGVISVGMSGYYSMDMHSSLNYVNEKDREEYFKKIFNRGSNKFKLTKFEYPDLSNANKILLKGNFDLQGYAKKVADEWYINLNLFKFYEHQEIDYPKRKSPIEFDHLSSRKYVTVLKVPDGYQVSYLPKSKTYKNDVWGFEMTYEQKSNQVILTQVFQNDHMFLQPDKFQEWNKVLEQLFPLYKETVSLSKK